MSKSEMTLKLYSDGFHTSLSGQFVFIAPVISDWEGHSL